MSDNTPESKGASPYGQNQPQYGEQSPSPYGQQSPSPYGQSSAPYGQADPGASNYPGQQYYPGPPAENPGRTLGIVGFILAIFIAPVGLIISIIAFVKSRKAGMGNGLALAGIIIGAIFTVLLVLGAIAFGALFNEIAQQFAEACEGLPSGTTVTVEGQALDCP
ncbi:DUF4190 domain-containing protein [Arthrobacter echini]|uniref:DUF4190 domain-containing protein n=1 Tax=Arthrobacter echini TaxID=1529066 RepID=A0A4S5E5G9_9MICC|nr:DUF4190 domain-containing protein [Arthrobacter echini]THJ66663.1 DUF4190 domain-containing protein [Arthrobacter echini]